LTCAIEAIYLHLKNDLNLRYEHERFFDEKTSEQFMRPPNMIKTENRGTCIDLVLLFISCLANAKMDPVYVHIRQCGTGEPVDHALAGAWLGEPAFEQENNSIGLKNDLLKYVNPVKRQDKRLVVIDSTGFTYGFPERQYKFSFEEAQKAALDCINSNCPLFALDIRQLGETALP